MVVVRRGGVIESTSARAVDADGGNARKLEIRGEMVRGTYRLLTVIAARWVRVIVEWVIGISALQTLFAWS
jgi:hypothetical protein